MNLQLLKTLNENDENSDFKQDLNIRKSIPFQNTNPDSDDLGILRTVPNASMVEKHRTAAGTYNELWIYNLTGDTKKSQSIYNEIVSGTDIPVNQEQNEDGTQHVEVWSVGNVRFVKLFGLTN